MANGAILAEYKRKLDNNETIPQNVTNGVVLTGMIEMYSKFDELKVSIDNLADCFDKYSVERKSRDAQDKLRDERNVTWPYLWENFGKDIVKILIAVAISYILLRAGFIH